MKENFIKVNENNLDLYIDIRYASSNNFTKKKIFLNLVFFIGRVAYEHLCKSVEISKKLGFKLKIFDAYRPTYVQKELWKCLPDPNFIAPPNKGSPHSRGVAVDLTLTKKWKRVKYGNRFRRIFKTVISR